MNALKITTAKYSKAHAASAAWSKQTQRAGQADYVARAAYFAAQLADARKSVDADAITALISETNGRCKRNTITLFSEVWALAVEAETKLQRAGVPTKLRAGATYQFRQAGPANSYKGQMNVSDITMVRVSDGWRLKSYSVASVSPRTSEIRVLTVSADAKRAIVQQAMEGFALAT